MLYMLLPLTKICLLKNGASVITKRWVCKMNCFGLREDAFHVLNVCFPKNEQSSMLLFSLDIKGIAASGGSACSSGSNTGSHVLAELPNSDNCQSIRFSFSRYTTKQEIDFALEKIKELVALSV